MKLPQYLLYKTLTIFSLSILVFGACNQTPEINYVVDQQAKARIDSALQSFAVSGKIAGVSALIFEKNKEVYYGNFGYADREAKEPMDRKTIAIIYSMTKPVTGAALMTLYEEGKFQLDDPLSKYAPEFENMEVFTGLDENGEFILEPLNRPITIRDLTRHTAGFASTGVPGLGELVKTVDPGNRNNTLSEMAEKMGSLPLMFQPGTQWAYGPSVDVQAFLVERLSGQPFEKYMRDKILDPLSMTETRYVVPAEDIDRMAAMYRRNDDGTVLSRVPDSTAYSFNTQKWPLSPGGYGLTATIDDYMKLARMFVNEGTLEGTTILKPETVQLMATNHLADSITERMWLPSKGQVGFGIDFAVRLRPPVDAKENSGVVGEFFWDGAASTMFWVDPVNELTAVLFVQLRPFDGIGLHKGFRDAVYGPFVPAEQ